MIQISENVWRKLMAPGLEKVNGLHNYVHDMFQVSEQGGLLGIS